MHIIESFCQGKKSPESCEDRLVITPHFIAVVDGATSSRPLPSGQPGGIVAANAVEATLQTLLSTATAQQFVNAATQAIATATGDWPDPTQNRPCASAIVYSVARQEIWRIGDSHAKVDDTDHIGEKDIDKIAYTFRATVVRAKLKLGLTTVEAEQALSVMENVHRPLTTTQGAFANTQNDPLSYGVLDGTPVPSRFIEVIPATGAQQIILCSDGFFTPPATLAAGLAELARLQTEDPLLCLTVNGGRPFAPGATLFDDTTYIRFIP